MPVRATFAGYVKSRETSGGNSSDKRRSHGSNASKPARVKSGDPNNGCRPKNGDSCAVISAMPGAKSIRVGRVFRFRILN